MGDYRTLVNEISKATLSRKASTGNTPLWQGVIVTHEESCMSLLGCECNCDYSLSINGEMVVVGNKPLRMEYIG